jgi:hypothetical protein
LIKTRFDSSSLVEESSKDYMLLNKRERKATGILLQKIIDGEYSQLFRDVSPYLLSFYKDLISSSKTS